MFAHALEGHTSSTYDGILVDGQVKYSCQTRDIVANTHERMRAQYKHKLRPSPHSIRPI